MDAQRGPLDVLVVGGGPAGSVTALLLAREGVRVSLIDRARFPRPKACGEFVNPGAVETLHRLGLGGTVTSRECNAISGWHLRTDGVVAAEGSYGDLQAGVGVSRAAFDFALLEAARAEGVDVREGVVARTVETTGLERGTARRPNVTTMVRSRGGPLEALRARILVGADGLNSMVSRSLGGLKRRPRLGKLSLSGHVRGRGPVRNRGHMFVGEGLTVGLAATGGADLWNATVVVDAAACGREVANGAAAFFASRLAQASFPFEEPPGLVAGPWASGPFDRPVRRIAGPDFVLVGDASGYYDPLTGQGIFRAIRSAELAAPRIAEALARPQRASRALAEYARALSRDRRAGRTVQHAIEHVMASSRSRRWVVKRLGSRAHGLDAMLRVTGDIAPPSSLMRPSVWAPMLRPGVQG